MVPKGEEGSHGHAARLHNIPPLGVSFEPGRFGRMVPELATPLVPPDEHLAELGLAMEDAGGGASGDNKNIPAAFTYLGQFIDHDITLDTTTLTEISQDPKGEVNFRTPRLDLDSVYGLGPRVQPSLYDRNSPGRAKLLLGVTSLGRNAEVKAGLEHDLPRNRQGFAIIGDERNDENLLVAQVHLAFMRFHNAMVDRLQGTVSDLDLFEAARTAVVHHYQAMVIRDFLAKICDPNAVALAIEKRRFFRFEYFSRYGAPYMPVEFSGAAYRLGHSMVRERYSHNRFFNRASGINSFNFFFLFTAKSGIIGTPNGPPTFPSDWIIDWRRYLDFKTKDKTGDFALNLSRKIDPYLISHLHSLPDGDLDKKSPDRSLAVMNLRRGVKLQLPAAQDLALFMGVEPLDPADIAAAGPDGAIAAKHGLHERTPLWYYILKEAELQQRGERLGQLGSTIVAETFVGLLQGDPESILTRDPHWRLGQPMRILTLPNANQSFSFADLVTMAAGGRTKELLSPVDDPANISAPVTQPTPEPAPAGE
ncbi:peroxidase family protein [Arenibaculum pallidiluteum]|uniref:peroxidase family protein n=1 Tax=Arenibaculum pallidiluteum TaxID=2812559 RepID=UPI001A96F092|nr:heme peroxidase family protein [Arenibaculum pallidiluteum]